MKETENLGVINNYETIKKEAEKAIIRIKNDRKNGISEYTNDEVMGILMSIYYND